VNNRRQWLVGNPLRDWPFHHFSVTVSFFFFKFLNSNFVFCFYLLTEVKRKNESVWKLLPTSPLHPNERLGSVISCLCHVAGIQNHPKSAQRLVNASSSSFFFSSLTFPPLSHKCVWRYQTGESRDSFVCVVWSLHTSNILSWVEPPAQGRVGGSWLQWEHRVARVCVVCRCVWWRQEPLFTG
jgi:hypothetical protein